MWKKYLKKLDLPESYVSITLGFLVVVVAGLLLYNRSTPATQPSVNTTTNTTLIQEIKEEALTTLPQAHTVAKSETLWAIAEKYYGTGYGWTAIVTENKLVNPNTIEVGQVLTIPVITGAQVPEPTGSMLATTTAPVAEKTYSVKVGDNLWRIAQQECNDGYVWSRIARDNKLLQPNVIHTGNVLTITCAR